MVGDSYTTQYDSSLSSQPPTFDPHSATNQSLPPILAPHMKPREALLPVSSLNSNQATTFDPHYNQHSINTQSLLPAPTRQAREAILPVPSPAMPDYGQPPISMTRHSPSSGHNPYAKPSGQPFVQNYAHSRNGSVSQPPQFDSQSDSLKTTAQAPVHSSPRSATPMNTSSHSLSDAGSPIPLSGGSYGLPRIPEETGGNSNEVINADNLSICIGSQNL